MFMWVLTSIKTQVCMCRCVCLIARTRLNASPHKVSHSVLGGRSGLVMVRVKSPGNERKSM